MSETLAKMLEGRKYDEIRNQMMHSYLEDTSKNYLALTPEEVNRKQPTWNKNDLLYGLKRLEKENGPIQFHHIYSDEEMEKKPILRDMGFIYLKAEERKQDYFVILLAGGAFGNCCNMVESIPAAARLNELGIDAFVLTYETATLASLESGLMPGPLVDISRTLDYIRNHRSKFGTVPDRYCLFGFSAGAYVTAAYGLKYREYKQEKPLALLLSYPLLSIGSIDNEKMRNLFLTGLYGAHNPLDKENEYNIFKNLTVDYPKTYAVLADDDNTVPQKDADLFFDRLDTLNIEGKLERVRCAGHGFGLGDFTEARGYVERFIESIGKKYE